MVELASESHPALLANDADLAWANAASASEHLIVKAYLNEEPPQNALNADETRIWESVYTAAIGTLLHYVDAPNAEAKRIADQAIVDYHATQSQ